MKTWGNTDLIKKYGLILIFSILFMLVFADSTSPLSRYYMGSDSSLFILMGKGIKEGYIPYIDLFDHKGPFLFFITYLSQLLWEGKTGFFIVEVLLLFLDLVFIDKIFDLADAKQDYRIRLLFYVVLLLFLAGTMEGGGTCEEVVLPMLLYSLYHTIKFFESNDSSFPLPVSFSLGMMFGAIALIRINSSIFLCSCCLCVVIVLILKKNYKNLVSISLICFTGLLAAVLPFVVWYYKMEALYEMLYSTFGFAFEYAISGANNGGLNNIISISNVPYLFIWFILLVLSIIVCKRKELILLVVLTTITTLINLMIGLGFLHYFELVIPCLVLYIYILIKYKQTVIITNCRPVTILLLIGLVGISFQATYNALCTAIHFLDYNITYKWDGYYKDFENQSVEIASLIPEEEKDSIWGYGVGSKFYLRTDLYPCIKYYDYIGVYDKNNMGNARDYIISVFEINPPKWVFVPAFESEMPDYLIRYLDSNYSLYACNDFLILYCAK